MSLETNQKQTYVPTMSLIWSSSSKCSGKMVLSGNGLKKNNFILVFIWH